MEERKHFGFVGLGLMGGALAMALRREGCLGEDGAVYAFDTDERVLEAGVASGVIDKGFTNPVELLEKSSVVFLCLYPASAISFMETYMSAFRPGTLITDIGGVKSGMVQRMEKILREDLDFIPGHPMAGSEKEGFTHAASCNFRGRNYIFVPLARNRPENIDYMINLVGRLGFTRVVQTTAQIHDRKIAFTSQLCHVIASALIDCENDMSITEFGGGSFEDLTRIAMINAPLWRELFLENRQALKAQIEKFEKSLGAFKALIDQGRGAELEKRLQQVRERRTAMASRGRCS